MNKHLQKPKIEPFGSKHFTLFNKTQNEKA